ncbi:MAG TPA: aminotransferase [Gemmatimonadaceae bacterium]|nr:aminotransferase [Gemmatimonadaceae bacterium]
MNIEHFAVEMWMNAYETRCRYNIAETCVDSITLGGLLDLVGDPAALDALRPRKLTYGDIEGAERLRAAIAALYADVTIDRVVTTHGAIGANALLYEALVGPGDEMVSLVPTYQQHVSIAESYGAQVKRLPLQREQRYLPDLDALARLVTPRTKLIALTNPNNPTGALIERPMLEAIARIAARHNAYVLCDEVYRGVNQDDDALTPSIVDLYERGIAVGSMSKAFALAGLRLGWIVAPREVREAVLIHRDYNTISVGIVDEYLATLALEHTDALLARNRAIVRTNLALLEAWVAQEPRLDWVKPRGGTVTLLDYALPLSSRDLCTRLLQEAGVLLMPGSALGMEGTVRIGFGNGTEVLRDGLAATSRVLAALPG